MSLQFARASFGLVCLILVLCSCSQPQKDSETLFSLLSPSESGIDFENMLTETDSLNVLNYEYFYNGAGVGVGDVNGDGLLDIYFGGNMVSSRLYINKGNLKFEDVTEKANVATSDWCTGIAMVDINQDGKLDIYVSTITPTLTGHSENIFFINQGNDANGIPLFEDMAHQLGVADTSYSTQAAFFDYDLDGDLDMYLLTNANERFVRSNPIGQRHDGTGRSNDKLFQNTGNDASGNPIFKDVSREAGLLSEGWGLGITVSDLNNDGYPDVYVANDFMANDHFYINNQDGTFSEQSGRRMKHQEMNGMGIDIGDLNNDGLPDIVVVDMLPEDNLRQKTMFSDIGYDRFQLALKRNYDPQYVRNVLQLNNGNGTFSDIGYFAGIHATDWSWTPLIADFDNDGWKDILITNGYVRDVTDLDFGTYANNVGMFGTPESRQKKLIEAANALPGINKPNALFRNNRDLTFTDVAAEWGLAVPSYSNGAAYADFDNDGDLDIVINNLNGKSFIFKNSLVGEGSSKSGSNYLRFKLIGNTGNSEGLGATVTVYQGATKQVTEYNPQRGYKSNVEPFVHFGVGDADAVDSVVVTWPGFKRQVLTNVKANQVLSIKEADAKNVQVKEAIQPTIFKKEDPSSLQVAFKHEDDEFIDFKVTPTLPKKHSQQGPAIASGDINGDGLEDFIIGGSANKQAVGYIQMPNGSFKKFQLPVKKEEDIGLLLFDADNDGDLDLYCVSGGSDFGKKGNYQDRLYLNDGRGQFSLSSNAPPAVSSGSTVIAHDFDHDGDLDLFVGGRIRPEEYPFAPDSYILQNDGKGKFTDVTKAIAPELQNVGMVTSAIWTDFDNDGWSDLLVVGEFMPVKFFRNVNGEKFVNESSLTIENSTGWWNSVTGGDIDNDGDIDYIVGNVGLNSVYKASPDQPVSIYAKDFDQNGSVDPIISRYIQGIEYSVHPRETLTGQIVGFKKKLRSYAIYGKTPIKDLLTAQMLTDAQTIRATEFRSGVLENLGNGKFAFRPLPKEAQFAPVYGTLLRDINGDGNLDLITIGNDYSTETLTGHYDAGTGNSFLGDGKGNFRPLTISESGFVVDKDAKGLISIPVKNTELIIATQNRDSVVMYSLAKKGAAFHAIRQDEVYGELHFSNGTKRRIEFYHGDSYLSQSARVISVDADVEKLVLFNAKGETRTIPMTANLSHSNNQGSGMVAEVGRNGMR